MAYKKLCNYYLICLQSSWFVYLVDFPLSVGLPWLVELSRLVNLPPLLIDCISWVPYIVGLPRLVDFAFLNSFASYLPTLLELPILVD